MWNVLGYTNDFINGKVDLNEFRNILINQRPLNSFINDCYIEILNSKYKEEYINNNGIIYPNNNYKNIIEFVLNCNDITLIQAQLKLLIDLDIKLNTH